MKNILLILAGVSLNAGAQILMKKGMAEIGVISFGSSLADALPRMFSSIFLWLAIIFYVTSCLVWMIVLSREEMSFAYPFTSFGFVIVTILGYFIFREHITLWRIIGVLLICFGVFFVSKR